MASFESYRTADGRTRHVAVVRIKGFGKRTKSFETARDAKEWAAEQEKELRALRDRGGAKAEVGTLTVRQLVEHFLEDPETRQRRYVPELEFLLGSWVDAYGTTKVRTFGRIQVETFRNGLLKRRTRPTQEHSPALTPARVNRYLSAMRRAWNWGLTKGYVPPSMAWPNDVMLREPPPKDVIATPAEVAEIFAACDNASAELGCLVRFLVGTGARLSDALRVTWRDIDLERGDVMLRGEKTGKPLRVAMLTPALDAARRARSLQHVSGRVFWQFANREAPRSPWLRARSSFPEHLRSMRLHDCRHLCASLLAAAGASDVELAAQLGHSTLTMVKRYAHLKGGHRGIAHSKVDALFGESPK